ncbi:MAG: hypothetical protein OXJ37_17250 [Bryobacterales bacterium]|nr:hypothetical protein [Bryobacterales bacterium]MDE0264155.1 hypothetical protein [Bryobacterales bacterium]
MTRRVLPLLLLAAVLPILLPAEPVNVRRIADIKIARECEPELAFRRNPDGPTSERRPIWPRTSPS